MSSLKPKLTVLGKCVVTFGGIVGLALAWWLRWWLALETTTWGPILGALGVLLGMAACPPLALRMSKP